jgi:hypothetical protein
MMQNYFKLFVLLCLTACSTSSKEDKLLQEAADVHNMALLMAEELETTLKQNTFPADSASAIRAAIEAWENDLVEVPGNEHHHNHEGHNSFARAGACNSRRDVATATGVETKN